MLSGNYTVIGALFFLGTCLSLPAVGMAGAGNVDTGQSSCYNNSGEIDCPPPDPFYGQDAQSTPQWLSSTKYVGTTMGEMGTLFGVNFADGRIKGYGYTAKRNKGHYEKAKTLLLGTNQFTTG